MANKTTKTFSKGIHFNDRKQQCEGLSIVDFALPAQVYLAVSQHTGAPATPVVNVGDVVKCGQLVAKASGNISANIHSSVNGTVKGIISRKNNFGTKSDYIHIETNGSEGEMLLPPLKNPSSAEIVNRVRECGIVGLGGAGFPTAVKLSPSVKVDTLLINAAECEPYLCCDNRMMIENTRLVAKGILYMAKALGVENVVVGIEENKQEAYSLLSNIEGLKVILLKAKYPQGAEKHLIDACLNRKVPLSKYPMDVGVVVQNVQTAFAVYEAVELGRPLTSRVLTVAGQAVKKPANLRVKIGTPYKAILDFCEVDYENTVKFIDGGPMMGNAMSDFDGVVVKTDSGLLCLTKDEVDKHEISPCINCARCAKSCPMKLMPMYIDFYTLAGDTDNAVKYGALHCCECGSCAYVCPARRAIVQSARLTKQIVRSKKK